MRQAYFTLENIREKASGMLEKVGDIRPRPEPLYLSRDSALIVLDMQSHFLDSSSHAFIPSAPAIIPGIQSLMDAFSGKGMTVVYTQHLNTPEDAGMMDEWWEDLIVESNPMSRITEQLTLTSGDFIRKCQYDAFYDTGLKDLLLSRGVAQVVVCGVMTHLCCETTARSAFVNGFNVWFTVDGTATYNEEFHTATLLNLSHGFAVPVLVEEVMGAVQRIDGR